MKLTLEIGSRTFVLGAHRWRMWKSREVTSFHAIFGPFKYTRKNLTFDRAAAGRVFDRLNHPDSPTRKLADKYRERC